MDDKYKELGFAQPDFLENKYGIRIYIGTIGQSDWAVEVPNNLCQYRYKSGLTYHLITEEMALQIAENWTKLAKERLQSKKG